MNAIIKYRGFVPSAQVQRSIGRPGLVVGLAAFISVVLIVGALAVIPVSPTIRAPALLVPAGDQTEIASPFRGRIDRLLVREGQRIRQGEPIAHLVSVAGDGAQSSRNEYATQLQAIEQQRNQVAELKDELQRRSVRLRHSQDEIALTLKAAIDADRRRALLARERSELLESGAKDRLVSRVDFLSASSEVLATEAALADRQRLLKQTRTENDAQLAQIDSELNKLDERVAELEGEAARIRLDLARFEDERRALVVAPRSGVIVSLPIPVGMVVEPNSALVRIAGSTDLVQVVARVPEDRADVLRVGQVATIEVQRSDSVHPTRLKARIISIGTSVAEKATREWQAPVTESRSIEVRLELQDKLSLGTEKLSAWANGRSSTAVIPYDPQPILSYLGKKNLAQ